MSSNARRLWVVAEPLHALTYFAPESSLAYEDAGLRGFWRGYFAGRAAPLGRTPDAVVTAVFFGFHPEFVARAIPSVWSLIDPADAIDARVDGVDRAMRRIFASGLPAHDAQRAADAIRDAVEGEPAAGHPLFGANRALPWPDAPHLALWHSATLLREHRGDGHVSALVASGLDPCEAHVLRIADDGSPPESIRPHRGWSDADWSRAVERLGERGWLEADRTTPEGARAREEIEVTTDRLSSRLVDRIQDLDLALTVFGAIAEQLGQAGEIPYPNPIGLPPSEPTWVRPNLRGDGD